MVSMKEKYVYNMKHSVRNMKWTGTTTKGLGTILKKVLSEICETNATFQPTAMGFVTQWCPVT